MEVRAVAKFVKVQPRKVRIVADEVRGKAAVHTAMMLQYHPSKAAHTLRKVLLSAMANAQENHGMNLNELKIAGIQINEGPRMKRIQARAMGRAYRILKKTSHITVVVDDSLVTTQVKPHGTKAKPRPSLAVAAKKGKKAATPKAAVAAPVEEKPVADVVENEEVVETAVETEVVTATETQEENKS